MQKIGYTFSETIEILQGKNNLEASMTIPSVLKQMKDKKARNPKAMMKTTVEKKRTPGLTDKKNGKKRPPRKEKIFQ